MVRARTGGAAAGRETVVYRRVDSCAGEVEAASNYFYSTRGERDECPPEPGKSVVILGSGPNRIGQGIEFDYCCVHAAQAFRALGYESVMVNCNPETVSTDYDTSDRLYFEPLDEEAVLGVLEREQPVGVCIQFGGQTPLKLARAIERAGYRIIGTPFDAVDLAEDRERFGGVLRDLRIRCPEWGTASGAQDAIAVAEQIGYPVLVRPSYVLGGRAMRVCYGPEQICAAFAHLEGPVLVDRFLEGRAGDRRRRALRRRGDVRRRCHGARRGGGRALGRLVVRATRPFARARAGEGDPLDRGTARAGARRRGADERPARRRRGGRLRARGQPASLAHGAVREQGDRRQPRRGRLPADGGRRVSRISRSLAAG